MRTLTLALLLAGAATAPLAAQGQDKFNWHGRIPAGQTLEIIGINGGIHATGTTGAEAQVTATKHGTGNFADVKIETVQHEGGVTICAVYPSRGERANECKAGGGHSETRDVKVSVEFEVQVPAGVKLVERTVNGDVSAENIGADVQATTVNGSITAAGNGVVRAHTVNGGIEAQMGRADWAGTLEFETVNGSVHLTLPANTSATVEAGTVNGSLSTDFPLTVQGKFMRNRITGTIGQGGRALKITTVNGSIQLSRR